MRTITLALAVAALGGATIALPSLVAAQDIEIAAKVAGRTLPRGYYERIARNPRFFELPELAAASATSSITLVGPEKRGRLPLLVIPALFSDSPQPPFASDAIQRVLFDGPSPHGTLREVYLQMSRGAFEVTGSVTPWVRTATTRAAAVGTSFGLGEEARIGDYLVQALDAADPFVDFGLYDDDGPDGVPNSADDDGVVDGVAFLFLERAASCGGNGIWPHAAGIASWTGSVHRTGDLRPNGQPVVVNGYIIQDATSCTSVEPLTPAVIAHELGHRIGLPDLYDSRAGIGPESRRWVVGCWELMSAGAWGCGAAAAGARRPTHMGPWSKARLGWSSPVIAANVRDREYVLRPADETNDVLRLPLGGGESLLLEYRLRQGYDVELASSGVLVYHVDTTRAGFLSPTPASRLYAVWTVEADGDDALMRTAAEGGNRGAAGDPFTTLGLATSASGQLLRLNDGGASTVTIHSIRIDAQARTATVRVTTTPEIQVAALGATATWAALAPAEQRWRATGGTLPYALAVTGTLPQGVQLQLRADTIVLAGVPVEAGAFSPAGTLVDAAGRSIAFAAGAFTITEPVIPASRLAQAMLRSGGAPLSAAEEALLDREGNGNGRYDVGDLRAYLRRHPDVATAMAARR